MFRPKAISGESMYSYVHRVAYYNGFKTITSFVSYVRQQKDYTISPLKIMASREFFHSLSKLLKASNLEQLKVEPEIKGYAERYRANIRLCIYCFAKNPILKSTWIFSSETICYKHNALLNEIEGIKINTKHVINWESLISYCQKESDLSKPSLIVQIVSKYGDSEDDFYKHIHSYFKWRLDLLRRIAMLNEDQYKRLKPALVSPPGLLFYEILNILSESEYVSNERAYEMAYWGIVDPLLRLEQLGVISLPRFYMEGCIELYSSHFLNYFPPPINTALFSDIDHPDKFYDLYIFDPALSVLGLKMMEPSTCMKQKNNNLEFS